MGSLHSLELLALEKAGLTGPIPSSIFNISSLKRIILVRNNFFGSLPGNMCLRLPMLEELNFNNNKLGGSIPGDIGNCSSLATIDLSRNIFTGLISEGIGKLTNLEALYLNLNRLSGPIPATIFNISSLRIISLVDNRLSGNLPSCKCLGLPNLEQLHLGLNNLSGKIPDIISNASKLTSIDLGSNMFTGPIPNSLDNPLNGALPVSIGNLSTFLESIVAGDCGFKGKIPNEIGNLSNLASLGLNNNYLIGSLPKTVKQLQRLQRLTVYKNQQQGSIPNELCNLQRLGTLGLGGNNFSGMVPACFGNISSLRYLALDSNKLTSTIPTSIWSLKDLLLLNLSSNSFVDNLPPDIGSLRAVLIIDLSVNRFSGQIPVTVGGLQSLLYLSLARNRLEGQIPESCGDMLSLQFLDLSHNNLSGAIPKSLEALSDLRRLNVSFNRLTGEIPRGGPFANFTNQSFLANEALCGAPQLQFPPCIAGSKHQSSRKTILLIICIPLSIASILLILIFAFALRRCRKRSKLPTQSDLFSEVTVERITYQELVRATDGFSESNLLGTGSFGLVYKGIFSHGRILAIKAFNLQREGAFTSFDTECEMLRNVRHRNLTKVISSCSNLDFKALVLEYMPNGSLEKWLYSHNYFLDMLQRLEIMIDVACALEYLHHGYSITVVHRDLKPSNVLLDEDMVAHVSDFGIAKFLVEGESVAQTKTLATFGYIAPEYGSEGLVSTKCDVYSYGITLMETFTRTKPTDEKFNGDLSLKRWVGESLLHNTIIQIIDASLLRPEEEDCTLKVRCVSSIMELALNCSSESPEERMDMVGVVAALKKIKVSFLANVKVACLSISEASVTAMWYLTRSD
ncbi:Receptor kinase-like protein Xa21, processed [Actinidia chinensis var. chinensis]|uniref:non-specific serine/threonine protein kinase n=1 Tax=Actinidia chinensis var. chinensis TaxID=1590841 RepID=A0A2R6PYV7_ACTCC|nr:Receptor kinase-like protein Xa21, processed [Actinidia chinensis var. chinensis]